MNLLVRSSNTTHKEHAIATAIVYSILLVLASCRIRNLLMRAKRFLIETKKQQLSVILLSLIWLMESHVNFADSWTTCSTLTATNRTHSAHSSPPRDAGVLA